MPEEIIELPQIQVVNNATTISVITDGVEEIYNKSEVLIGGVFQPEANAAQIQILKDSPGKGYAPVCIIEVKNVTNQPDWVSGTEEAWGVAVAEMRSWL